MSTIVKTLHIAEKIHGRGLAESMLSVSHGVDCVIL